MRPALWDIEKVSEIDDLGAVVHLGLKLEIVPVRPRWPVLHVALVKDNLNSYVNKAALASR
jgi:hypothetical protein